MRRSSSSSCPFYIPCSSITPALGQDVGVSSPSLSSPLLLPVLCCGAGAGFTVVQAQQHYVLKLLCHLDYSRFCLLLIQFITSMTEINCQQKRASTSCALRPILTTWDWFSDPPKKKYLLLFPKLIQFLWTVFCSSSATISREASCWV